ncbi:hypothetical protein NQ317_018167 [Molorchus minor]|uniref:Cuticle protein n=1 Tax=Molorchus minor TaxID=1323400 RepID=A0ABQ9JXR9_9CUCU|nr:hypothetical protein NQ317_018167 [Molorchus minor]
MAFKLVVFTTVLAVTKASVVSGGTAYLQPSISVPVARTVIAEPHDPNPQYSFGYDVQDPFTGDNHGQVESRSGDVVTGRYSLIDSDGTRRVNPLVVRAVVAEQPVAPVAVAAPQRVAAVAYGAPQPVLPPAPLAGSPVVAEPWAVNVAPVTASLVGSSVRSGPVVADEPWAVSSVAADPWPVSGGFECPY